MSRTLRPAVLVVVSALWVVIGGAAPAAAGGGCHGGGFADATTTQIDAVGNCFAPTVARVDVGDRVRWHNIDAVPHTVTGAAGSFEGGELDAKGRSTWTFTEAGVYPYSCLLHPGMVGAVVVGNGGAAAGTADESDEAGTAGASSPAETAAAPAAAAVTSTTSATSALDAVLPWATAALTAAVAVVLAGVLIRRRRNPSATPY